MLALTALFIGTLIVVPIFFKDNIRELINREVSKNLKASVYFDADRIGITFFKSFPDLTLTLEDFGLVGVESFSEDTLVAMEEFGLTIDVINLIFGDEVEVKSINLLNPRMILLIDENGQANYDIVIEGETATDVSDTVSDGGLTVSIKSWNVQNGRMVYYDHSTNFLMALDGIHHTGSGNFSLDNFDLNTSTTVERMMASYEDVEYLKDKQLIAEVTLHVDMSNQRYTFKDNVFSLNDFHFGIEGFLEMLPEYYNLDMSFYGQDNTVKSILSLIPGAYTEDFRDIEAEGLLDFQGSLKGIYDVEKELLPSFNLQLLAENGRIKYPDLPESISNIQFDMVLDNATGSYEKTVIDLKQLHLELGNNPVDATLKMYNLVDYRLDAVVNADVNLGDVSKFYPLEDTDLSGKIDVDLEIHGVYDSVKHIIPMEGKVEITDLYYKSGELQQGLAIQSSDLIFNTANIEVQNFIGRLGNTDMRLNGHLSNYIDYIFEKNSILGGKFDFYSTLVDVNEWAATEEGSSEKPVDVDSASNRIIKVPRNIDFVLDSKIDKVLYDNLVLKDFKGQLVVRDGALYFNEVGFNTLGGLFSLKGAYDTREEDHPKFDFNLAIKDLSIPEAYRHFMTVQMLAPIAEIMEGSFSSDFSLNGELKDNFLPDLATLSGKGILNIAKAAIIGSQSNVISGITSVSNLTTESTNVGLANVLLSTEVENGRVFTQPFNVRFGENNALIAGSSGLDGTLDYNVKLDVPPQVIETAGSLLSSVTGQSVDLKSGDVKLNLEVKGKYDNPAIKVLGIESGESKKAAETALKAKVEAEKEKVIEQADSLLEVQKDQAPEEVQKIMEEHGEEIQKAKDRLQKFFKKDEGE